MRIAVMDYSVCSVYVYVIPESEIADTEPLVRDLEEIGVLEHDDHLFDELPMDESDIIELWLCKVKGFRMENIYIMVERMKKPITWNGKVVNCCIHREDKPFLGNDCYKCKKRTEIVHCSGYCNETCKDYYYPTQLNLFDL